MHLCSDFAQFLTVPGSDHRPPTKMADPPMESSFHLLHAWCTQLWIKRAKNKFCWHWISPFFLQAIFLKLTLRFGGFFTMNLMCYGTPCISIWKLFRSLLVRINQEGIYVRLIEYGLSQRKTTTLYYTLAPASLLGARAPANCRQAPTDPPRSCNLKQHFWTASTHSIVATLGLLRYALIVVTRFPPVVQLEQ
jgi:hypothetical protein